MLDDFRKTKVIAYLMIINVLLSFNWLEPQGRANTLITELYLLISIKIIKQLISTLVFSNSLDSASLLDNER